jgi:hypothetical protein
MIVLGAAMAMPASASAETVTIGSSLTNSHDADHAPAQCTPGCTAAQPHHSAAIHPLVAPVNGLITQWLVRTGQAGATYRLRTLRPAGSFFFCVPPDAPNAPPNYCPYAFAGSSVITPPVPDAADLNRAYTASVPISQGDAIGLESVSGPGVPIHAGTGLLAFHRTDADGSAHLFDTDYGEVLVQATVSFCRVPSVVGQKRAAARASLAGADCAAQVERRKLKRSKKNRKRRGKVLEQGTVPGFTVAPGTPVTITVAALRKKKRKKKG